ncbi:MAG: TRAP transporter substrate-binding protein [Spirochaetales bacterium]|nr:TRAP transporter substrate-binding protein [Spirochaetales bacterium]
MKKTILLTVCILVASLTVFAGGQEEAAGGGADVKAELKFGHYLAESHAAHKAALQFAEAVKERTNGMITVSIYPGSVLGNSPELNEQVTLGSLDLVIPTDPAVAKYVPVFNLVTAPFAFATYDAVDAFFNTGFMDWAEPQLQDAGFEFLGRWEYGFRTFTCSKKQLNTPDDFVGLKFRTPPDFVNSATVTALGGNAETIAWTELPMALSQGRVDGQENPVATIHSAQMWETQKYISMLNYTYNATYLLMNKAKFDSLSANQQKILKEEAVKAGLFMQNEIRSNEKAQLADMESNGMEVAWPDTAPFAEKASSVWEILKGKVGVAGYNKFMDYYTASRK